MVGRGTAQTFIWSWLAGGAEPPLLCCWRRRLAARPGPLSAPEIDGRALREMVDGWLGGWKVDRERILVDGALGRRDDDVVSRLRRRRPLYASRPDLRRAASHEFRHRESRSCAGEADPAHSWCSRLDVPRQSGPEAAKVLEDAGAELVYQEIEDLSHTYPREENARLIEWLDPSRRASSALSLRRVARASRPVMSSPLILDVIFRRGSAGDDHATLGPALGPEVDDPVGGLDHVEVVLDDDDRVARFDELVEHVEELRDVVEVQARRRLVEDVERAAGGALGQLARELDALGLAARERRRRLAEMDVVEADASSSCSWPRSWDGREELERLATVSSRTSAMECPCSGLAASRR